MEIKNLGLIFWIALFFLNLFLILFWNGIIQDTITTISLIIIIINLLITKKKTQK